jgi:hypothetical protein
MGPRPTPLTAMGRALRRTKSEFSVGTARGGWECDASRVDGEAVAVEEGDVEDEEVGRAAAVATGADCVVAFFAGADAGKVE